MAKYQTTKLKEAVIAALKTDEIVMDTEVKGLGIRRQDNARVYFVRKHARGRRHYESIGEHGQPWTLTTARERALKIIHSLNEGYSPAERRRHEQAVPTITELAALFLHKHVRPKRKRLTAESYESTLRNHVFPVVGAIRTDKITPAQVSALHLSLKDMPSAANRVVAVLSAMFGWAEQQGYRDKGANPCADIEPFTEKGRERFLTVAEFLRLGEVLETTEKDANPFAVAAIRLLIFTGARRDEVRTLRWEHVDLERGMLFLPDSKSGKKSIHLSPPAVAVLERLPRIDGNPFVIVGDRVGRPLINIQKPWNKIRLAAGLAGVRLHDLRHSFASIAADRGGSLLAIGKLLGHSQAATTARYAHLAADPMRDLNMQVGNKIADALGQREQRKQVVSPNTAKD